MTFSLVHAVSLSEQIEKFGAYAGLAAVVGLGVLSLLYFSQAREVKRLREWAGRSPERAAELEQRVAMDAQRRVVAQPAAAPQTVAAQQAPRPATAAATVAGAQSRPAGAPSAPGGPFAPAAPVPGAGAGAGAGARIFPASGTQPVRAQVPSPPGSPAPPAAPGSAPGAPAPGAPVAAPGIASPAAVPGPSAGAPGAVPAQPAASPSTGVPGGPAAARPAAPTPRAGSFNGPAGASAVRPQAGLPPLSTPAAQASRYAISPLEAPSGPGATRRDAPRRSRRTAVIAGGVAATLAVGVLATVLLTGGGDDEPPQGNRIGAAPAPGASAPPEPAGEERPARGAPVNRRNTTVAVLNGTTRDGLARNVGNKIEEGGFALGTVGNNADQARSATIVSYTPGNRRAAQTVAELVRVGKDAVEPIDRNTAVAAPGARVVVTVGADRVE